MSPHAALQLSGPHACELLSPEDEAALRARRGDDPLREDASPARAFEALRSTRVSIAQALLDQGRISGVGNILRAEGLILARLPPLRPAEVSGRGDGLTPPGSPARRAVTAPGVEPCQGPA